MTKIYNRESKEFCDDSQYGSKGLDFLYNNLFGRIILKFISSHLCANLYLLYNKSRLSKRKISYFIHQYRLKDVETDQFKSFAEFFSRREERNLTLSKNTLISPADAKVLCYKINDRQLIIIKHSTSSIRDLTSFELSEYAGGSCLVFRLAMDDYHRYCFVDSGKLVESKHIRGKLHTVRPISEKYRVFAQNDRVVNRLKTKHFGDIIQVEVGAMLVGRIHNYNKKSFTKGEEKGFFELGGSTIVLLLKKGIYIDKDIVAQSANGIETIVKYGEIIGGKENV